MHLVVIGAQPGVSWNLFGDTNCLQETIQNARVGFLNNYGPWFWCGPISLFSAPLGTDRLHIHEVKATLHWLTGQL